MKCQHIGIINIFRLVRVNNRLVSNIHIFFIIITGPHTPWHVTWKYVHIQSNNLARACDGFDLRPLIKVRRTSLKHVPADKTSN